MHVVPALPAAPTGLRRDKNVTSSALFGVAAIQTVIGSLAYFVYSADLGLLDRIIAFGGAFYIALGIAARWSRLPSAAIGAILYAAYLVFQASHSMALLMTGLIFKIPILILLLLAVLFALPQRCSPVCAASDASLRT